MISNFSHSPSTSAEFIDYHLSPEVTSPSSPHEDQNGISTEPRILNSGPPGHVENVTTQLGAAATIGCVVRNLGNKTVSLNSNLGQLSQFDVFQW